MRLIFCRPLMKRCGSNCTTVCETDLLLNDAVTILQVDIQQIPIIKEMQRVFPLRPQVLSLR